MSREFFPAYQGLIPDQERIPLHSGIFLDELHVAL
jgi:hypothetical protein